MRRFVMSGIGMALAAAAAATPALADRDPAYAAARAAGQIGERPNGKLGIVGEPTTELRRLVDEINIQRGKVYAEKARANNVTPEAYALTTACQLILKTATGEKYAAPDGTWKTRTSEPPERDPRCP